MLARASHRAWACPSMDSGRSKKMRLAGSPDLSPNASPAESSGAPDSQLARGRSGRRKGKTERRAYARFRIDADRSAMPLHRGVDHREAKPGPFLAFGGEERLEDALRNLGRHPRSVVGHLDPDA